jgi:hypothetical protein
MPDATFIGEQFELFVFLPPRAHRNVSVYRVFVRAYHIYRKKGWFFSDPEA